MEIACYIRCDATFLRVNDMLVQSGFTCSRFVQDTALLRALRHQSFDMILAETSSGSGSSGEGFHWMMSCTDRTMPIVMISPLDDTSGVTRALEAGADSFIYYPLELPELGARLKTIHRRHGRRSSPKRIIETEHFRLDRDTGVLLKHGVPVALRPREFMMAWVLFSAAGSFVSRAEISVAVWGVDSEITNRTIEQHIYMLRKKLELSVESGAWIRTTYSKGYCLQLEPSSDRAGAVEETTVTAESAGLFQAAQVSPLSRTCSSTTY